MRMHRTIAAAALLLGALACDEDAPPAAGAEEPVTRESMRASGLRLDAGNFAAQTFAQIAAGNYEQASITARRAVQADPTHPSAQHALAWAAMHEGRQNVQILAALEAVKLAPDSAHFRRTLGMVFQNSNRMRDARDAYREAVRLNPADTLSWRDLGRTAYAAGSYALADSAFDRLAEMVPTYFDTATADAELRTVASRAGTEQASGRSP